MAKQAPVFKTPGLGIALGILAGMAIVVVLLVTDFGRSKGQATNLSTPTAAADFSKSWKKMYESTWLQTKMFTRTAPDGRATSSTSAEAHRPPDSVQIGSGNITTIRDGQRTVCTQGVSGAQGSCRPPTPIDTAALTAQEVSATQGLTSGDNALYSVSERDKSCFYLELTTVGLSKSVLDQPWGTRSAFCFDAKTHALLTARVERDGTTDVVTSKYLVGTVTDNDLDRLSRGDTSFLPQ